MSVTKDHERLAQIAGQLTEAITAARAGERVRLPVLRSADAAGLVMNMHGQLDEAIDERSAEAARDGHHIACSAGCSSCCVAPVLVSEGEAVTVAEWLKLPEHAAVRAAFAAAYPAWKKQLGGAVDAMHRAETDDERRAAAVQLKRKNVMCAFNRDGMCSIYEARPARCRKAHALVTNAHCGAEGDGLVQYLEHPKTELVFEEQETMRAAIHQALRPNGSFELLCAAVHRLLGATVGRNDPCPCGSGQKSKRCCGA